MKRLTWLVLVLVSQSVFAWGGGCPSPRSEYSFAYWGSTVPGTVEYKLTEVGSFAFDCRGGNCEMTGTGEIKVFLPDGNGLINQERFESHTVVADDNCLWRVEFCAYWNDPPYIEGQNLFCDRSVSFVLSDNRRTIYGHVTADGTSASITGRAK